MERGQQMFLNASVYFGRSEQRAGSKIETRLLVFKLSEPIISKNTNQNFANSTFLLSLQNRLYIFLLFPYFLSIKFIAIRNDVVFIYLPCYSHY